MDGTLYIDNFVGFDNLFDEVIKTSTWDDTMSSRRTSSFGVPYNYSGIEYPTKPMTKTLVLICDTINELLGWRPNNCLVNHYIDGKSKMGWHSDRTDILEEGSGVVIISLGNTRTLKFREINNKDNKVSFELLDNSLFYMTSDLQNTWNHSIMGGDGERISLTFRKILIDDK
tara:strand:- start:169 stop:684 length:516 start_codon:yes stop_codon:yes gene_type:complete